MFSELPKGIGKGYGLAGWVAGAFAPPTHSTPRGLVGIWVDGAG
jgi:hypothetical protein